MIRKLVSDITLYLMLKVLKKKETDTIKEEVTGLIKRGVSEKDVFRQIDNQIDRKEYRLLFITGPVSLISSIILMSLFEVLTPINVSTPGILGYLVIGICTTPTFINCLWSFYLHKKPETFYYKLINKVLETSPDKQSLLEQLPKNKVLLLDKVAKKEFKAGREDFCIKHFNQTSPELIKVLETRSKDSKYLAEITNPQSENYKKLSKQFKLKKK